MYVILCWDGYRLLDQDNFDKLQDYYWYTEARFMVEQEDADGMRFYARKVSND